MPIHIQRAGEQAQFTDHEGDTLVVTGDRTAIHLEEHNARGGVTAVHVYREHLEDLIAALVLLRGEEAATLAFGGEACETLEVTLDHYVKHNYTLKLTKKDGTVLDVQLTRAANEDTNLHATYYARRWDENAAFGHELVGDEFVVSPYKGDVLHVY